MIHNYMPQLVPFFFIGEITFVFLLLALMIYIFSKYILPKFLTLMLTRIVILEEF